MAEFDGSIFATVGADIKDYQQAMDQIAASTQRAFQKAQDAAVNSSNSMVQKVGQIMAQLASNGQPLGQRLGNAFSTGLNLSLGSIQRIAASIGEKIPQPIKNGFNQALTAIQSGVNAVSNKIPAPIKNAFTTAFTGVSSAASAMVSKVNSAFTTVTTKANSAANTISNSFAGKVMSSVTNLSTKLASGLGSGFTSMSAKATSALNGISAKVGELGSSITGATTKVAALGAAFAVFQGFKTAVVGSVQKAADFEAKMSNIKALTGASAETMKKFNAAAQKAGADTAFSASEAADAIAELSKAGVSTADILNGGLTGALNLATAGELSLTESAEVASTALNAFKADGLSVTDAANQLAGAANASATDVHELKYGLSAVSAVAAGTGMSFRDTSNALAVFAQNGLKGSDAGTSLKTMLMRLQPTTKGQINQMKQLGIVTEDGTNKFFTAEGKVKSFAEVSQVLQDALKGLTPQQQQMALQTMFGSDAVRAATIAMKEGAKGANEMQAAIDKVTAAQVAAEKLNNLKGAVEILSGSFETLQIKLGTAFLPILKDLVQWIDKLVNKFMDSKGLQTFIDAISAIEPKLDNLINGTKMSAEQTKAFNSALKTLAPTIAGIVGAFSFGPILKGLGMVGTALGTLGAGAISSSGVIAGAFSKISGLVGAFCRWHDWLAWYFC